MKHKVVIILVSVVFIICVTLWIRTGKHITSSMATHEEPTHIVRNKFGAKDCSTLGPQQFYGQGFEDKALYDRFFSKPHLCNGAFLEIGALDGVRFSNTLMFESVLNWNGILIEASPSSFKKLEQNRPNSTVIHSAVCKDGIDHVEFVANGGGAVQGIVGEMTEKHISHFKLNTSNTVKVPCSPLGTIIRNHGYSSLDFAVIDVEGAELMVLETHDWSIPVHVFVVEMNRQREEILSLFNKHGYRKTEWNIKEYCPNKKACPNNDVFVKMN